MWSLYSFTRDAGVPPLRSLDSSPSGGRAAPLGCLPVTVSEFTISLIYVRAGGRRRNRRCFSHHKAWFSGGGSEATGGIGGPAAGTQEPEKRHLRGQGRSHVCLAQPPLWRRSWRTPLVSTHLRREQLVGDSVFCGLRK